MAKKINGSAKWVGLALTLITMVFVFGQKSKALEKDDEANATAIVVVQKQCDKANEITRGDLSEIKTDIKTLLSRP